MKKQYISPDIEISMFKDDSIITTSYTIDQFDDGALYDDKW